jgi:lipopolysaccharide transport system ATP-binding protein
MNTVIEVKNLGKSYNIIHNRSLGYITLRDSITAIFRNPLNFIWQKTKKIRGVNTKEKFWALKDINFEIEKGEVVGIIGPNGAGKSTLLKILTGITPPTTGEVKIKGKIASLLEVGTGFHPELTGKENIFLNGAILGMRRKEISEKLDQIVKFADIEKFIDTPVKYYSSGMYVRLAFSVAAHMEPDILLVDEVLAVGDAEFQQKCLGKMEDVTRAEGRTILFVSHNMGAIRSLCKKVILIERGSVRMVGNAHEVIDYYLSGRHGTQAVSEFAVDPKRQAQIQVISIVNKDKKPTTTIPLSESFSIEIDFVVKEKLYDTLLALFFYSNGDLILFSTEADAAVPFPNYEPGTYHAKVTIPANLFNTGRYFFKVEILKPAIELVDGKQDLQFEIIDTQGLNKTTTLQGYNVGKIGTMLDFSVKKI